MPLFEFTNKNKYGNLRKRIVYSDSTAFTFNPKGLGDFVCVRPFKYESRSKYHGVFNSPVDGKRYLTPDWIEVHPDTTINDITYQEPKPVKEKPTQWEFKSESSNAVYKVRYNGIKLSCNCPGSWRAFDRRCKHIKSVESQIK